LILTLFVSHKTDSKKGAALLKCIFKRLILLATAFAN